MNQILTIQLTPNDLKELIRNAVKEEIKLLNNSPPVKEDEYLSRKKASFILGISTQTLGKYTKNKLIVGYRIGGLVKYKRSEIELALTKIQTSKIN
ncbi:MAG: helix-turn-helix domain-containing protein [Bacteroidota bacterium]|nr:helix-turn-helix domain-containing protein [Bacteroidota bacterium]